MQLKSYWKMPFQWGQLCWLEKAWHATIVGVIHAATSRMTEKALRMTTGSLNTQISMSSQIWPATGIAWAMLDLLGYYVWPGTFVALLYDNIFVGEGLPDDLWLRVPSGFFISATSQIQSLLGVYAIQWMRRRSYSVLDLCELGCGCVTDNSVETEGHGGRRPFCRNVLKWQHCKRNVVCKRRLALTKSWPDEVAQQRASGVPRLPSRWWCGGSPIGPPETGVVLPVYTPPKAEAASRARSSNGNGHGKSNGNGNGNIGNGSMLDHSSRVTLSGRLPYEAPLDSRRGVLLRRKGVDTMMEASWFFFVGLTVCAMTNVVTVLAIFVFLDLSWATFFGMYVSWWLGDVSGLLVMYPLAVAFSQPAMRLWRCTVHTAKAVGPMVGVRAAPFSRLPSHLNEVSESSKEMADTEEGILDSNFPSHFPCSHLPRAGEKGSYERFLGQEEMGVWHHLATINRTRFWRIIEVFLLISGLVITITVIFGELTKSDFVWPLPYLVLPYVIWAAFRFNRQVLSLTLFIIMLGVSLASESYVGPFSHRSETTETQLHIQIFVCVVCLMGISLSAAVRERRQFAEELYHINSTLEHQVLRRTEQLQVSQQMAEAASQAKSEFLANMSHEIRTPIHGIMGITQLVMETSLDDEQRENLGTVLRSCEWLLETVNSILDLSKIEAGRQEVEHLSFNIRTYLDGTRKMLQNKFKEKGVELRWQVDPNMPRFVIGDPGKINHCVINLLGNALKFTSAGHVTLRVQKLDTPIPIGTSITGAPVGLPPQVPPPGRRMQDRGVCIDGNNHTARPDHRCSGTRLPEARPSPLQRALLLISVADTGIGIRKEKLQDVFQPFVQADTSTTRLYGGTGLGLTIVERVVRMLGGSMWVESEEGVGTTFFFTTEVQLVAESSEPQPVQDAHSVEECLEKSVEETTTVSVEEPMCRQRFKGLRVLLAEDNLVNQKVACGQLKKIGMVVSIANNGKEALDAIRNNPNSFDIVLMDVQMPEMDGLVATMHIRRDEAQLGLQRLPILGLTAHAIEGYKDKCFEAGMDGYCTKPFKLAQMLTAMHNVLLPPRPNLAPDGPPPSSARTLL